MARQDDWYTSADWDDAAQALFWKKLRRARRRAVPVYSKSARLWTSGQRAEARALVVAAREHGVEGELQLARFALDEGDLAPAEARFRAARDRESLARVLVRSPDPAKQREARALFEADRRRDFGRLFGPWEEVATRVMDFPDFSTSAEGLRARHEGEHQAWLRDALRTPDLRAVEALDRALRTQSYPALFDEISLPHAPRRQAPPPVLVERYLASLGAFLGEVLVRERGGRWITRAPAPLSTVKVGRRELDPFRQAYETLFFEQLPGALVATPSPTRRRSAR